ncbi:hypothetical protein BJY18_002938 [Amycolatopsis jiangsuensis]|uniref:Uncharacterized protein n=1 Tax=Amycolatopsis jiangsuensis TaxID=1181879 RepID=A0A840IUI5_9PSEU|nr:hypothetical protein [Amycolatopsis jiangsuensis]
MTLIAGKRLPESPMLGLPLRELLDQSYLVDIAYPGAGCS